MTFDLSPWLCSVADKAWWMLRTALQKVGKEEQAKVLRQVAWKLLSMGRDLPQWLLDTYKVRGLRTLWVG